MAVEAIAAGDLRKLGAELRDVVAGSERSIEALARDFEQLAREVGQILETAKAIIHCAEGARLAQVLPAVDQLSTATQSFLREKLEATAGILETVVEEATLLERLGQLTRGQKAIVKETGMLRLLTNIEVARLGEVGAGFQYLAEELDDFSQAVGRSTQELTSHTGERKKSIAETRNTLTTELPEMRQDFQRMGEGLQGALVEVERSLGQLRQTPERFQSCMEEIGEQIAGVVAAIQAHDITRQQIEHVHAALESMGEETESNDAGNVNRMRAGLAIQSYQLRNARETMRGWTKQIRECLERIGSIASSEILDLAPMVLAQEGALAAQVERIESLEEECEARDAKVRASLGGMDGLMDLVSEHLQRSKTVRERLQLLMFNSIIEASHLGTQADGILEISTTIKRISAAWGEITAETEAATGQIRALVDGSRATLETFSGKRNENLSEARARTVESMQTMREAADCAESRGREIQAAMTALGLKLDEIGRAADSLEGCLDPLTPALDQIDAARGTLASSEGAGATAGLDREGLERQFGASYTTEMERIVMRAALEGGPLPSPQQSFAGNNVELF